MIIDGSYFGKDSFDVFTHRRSSIDVLRIQDWLQVKTEGDSKDTGLILHLACGSVLDGMDEFLKDDVGYEHVIIRHYRARFEDGLLKRVHGWNSLSHPLGNILSEAYP